MQAPPQTCAHTGTYIFATLIQLCTHTHRPRRTLTCKHACTHMCTRAHTHRAILPASPTDSQIQILSHGCFLGTPRASSRWSSQRTATEPRTGEGTAGLWAQWEPGSYRATGEPRDMHFLQAWATLWEPLFLNSMCHQGDLGSREEMTSVILSVYTLCSWCAPGCGRSSYLPENTLLSGKNQTQKSGVECFLS